MKIDIKRKSNMKICVTDENDGYIESQSVESNLQFAILEKLEEIRMGLIDIESNTDTQFRKKL